MAYLLMPGKVISILGKWAYCMQGKCKWEAN